MNNILARKLISKGAVRQDTVFQALHNATGLSGQKNSLVEANFVLIAARARTDGSVVFEARRAGSTEQVRLLSTQVTGVDGMDLTRFAATYDLNLDGSDKKVGKRRGRRPRALIEAMQREAEALAAQAEASQAQSDDTAQNHHAASDEMDDADDEAVEDEFDHDDDFVETDHSYVQATSTMTVPMVVTTSIQGPISAAR